MQASQYVSTPEACVPMGLCSQPRHSSQPQYANYLVSWGRGSGSKLLTGRTLVLTLLGLMDAASAVA